jgi:PITH domain
MTSTAGDNITNLLHKSLCCCLNEDLRAPHTNLFVGDHTLPLRSDADEQLLLQLGFNQTMKLSSIVLGVPDNSSCPKTIKLFCNQGNLGFDDAAGRYTLKQLFWCRGTFLFMLVEAVYSQGLSAYVAGCQLQRLKSPQFISYQPDISQSADY